MLMTDRLKKPSKENQIKEQHKLEVERLLNGYGRVIEFGSSLVDKSGELVPDDPSRNYIVSFSQGLFSDGKK